MDDLQILSGIGPSLAQDLRDLGYARVTDLVGEEPRHMFDSLCDLRGERIDRCVLYVFRCAVYQAEADRPDPDLKLWWNWKDAR
jgi:pathogenicity locus Cdd1 protein